VKTSCPSAENASETRVSLKVERGFPFAARRKKEAEKCRRCRESLCFGGGAGKGLFPPHPRAKEKTLGTRLEVILVPLSGTETMGEMLIYGVKGVRIY